MARGSHSPIRLTVAFWLLVVSWACANVRPGLIVSWMSEVARVSHQQRLTLEVMALLAGAKEQASTAVATAEMPVASKPIAAPQGAFKKLEVPLPRPARVFAAAVTAEGAWPDLARLAGEARAAPPHGPPRAGAVG